MAPSALRGVWHLGHWAEASDKVGASVPGRVALPIGTQGAELGVKNAPSAKDGLPSKRGLQMAVAVGFVHWGEREDVGFEIFDLVIRDAGMGRIKEDREKGVPSGAGPWRMARPPANDGPFPSKSVWHAVQQAALNRQRPHVFASSLAAQAALVACLPLESGEDGAHIGAVGRHDLLRHLMLAAPSAKAVPTRPTPRMPARQKDCDRVKHGYHHFRLPMDVLHCVTNSRRPDFFFRGLLKDK